MLAADSASPAAVQRYTERVFGMHIPEAQLRAIGRYDAAGKLSANVTPPLVDSLMLAGCGHPDWAAVQAPALVFDAVVDSAPQLFPAWTQYDSASQAAGRRFASVLEGWTTAQRAIRAHRLARANVVSLHGANHYVFDSHGTPVATAMRRFLGTP
jgi:hypothetical protein